MPSPTDTHDAMVETLREKARLASLRADISEAFNRREDLDVVLQACTGALVKNLEAAFARIWVLDRTGQVLELRASSGLYTHLDGDHGRVRVGDFKIGRIAKNAKPHISNSVTTDPEVSNPEWAQREGMISFAGYPLIMEGRVLGVVAFFARKTLSADVLNELAPIADGIAQWIKRKQAENDFAEQREWLNVTLRSIGDAVVATDRDGRVTFINRVAENLTGWESDEALRQPLETVFHILDEATRQPVDNPVTLALSEERIVVSTQPAVLLPRSGPEVPIDHSASPIRNEKGDILGVIVVFHEITARRQAEKQREEALQQAQDARREAEILHRVGRELSSELELTKVVQTAVDAGRELCGAEFGVFFYNATGDEGSQFLHIALSGVTPGEFAELGLSRSTPLLASTFAGEGVLRINDLRIKNQRPKGVDSTATEPFASFLAAPVISRSGNVLGGLFFGHSEPWKFSTMFSRLIEGVAAQAAIALDNSHLYGALAQAKAELASHPGNSRS
jgi:PAS domain S-box-containing protein